MKKLFVFMILCLAFLLIVPGIVSAEDDTNGGESVGTIESHTKSGTTTITYGLHEVYQLIIPSDFTLDKNQAMYEDVVVANALLKPYTKVQVNVTSENYDESIGYPNPAWGMKHQDNDTEFVRYHLHLAEYDATQNEYNEKQDGRLASGNVILEAHAEDFENGNGRIEAYLKFFIPDTETADYAGNYKDELEFTATIVQCTEHNIIP